MTNIAESIGILGAATLAIERAREEVAKFDPSSVGETYSSLGQALDRYATQVHKLNRIWWYDELGNLLDLNFGERMQLILSEIAEAMEGYRRDLMDDHLPQYKSLWVELADGVIRLLDCSGAYGWRFAYGRIDMLIPANETNVAAKLLNLSDFVIRIAHVRLEDDPRPWLVENLCWHFLAQSFDIATDNSCPDFWQVVYDKLVYNRVRADHKYEARKLPGGKKF